MKALILIILLSLSFTTFSGSKKPASELDPDWKKKEFKSYLKQNHKFRVEQELKLFKKQKEFLSRYYQKKLAHLKEIAKIQDQMELGKPAKNKKILNILKKKKRAFEKNQKREREDFFQKDLKAQIDKYNQKMKQRKGLFNGRIIN